MMEQYTLMKKNINLIKEYRNHGGIFSIVTGRCKKVASTVFENFANTMKYIMNF